MITSAGIIPVHFRGKKPFFLLLRAYTYWDFPKGVVEEGESDIDAALRELKEETGIAAAALDWGNDFYETEIYSNLKKARYFAAAVATDQVTLTRNQKTGIIEHHEYRWCSVDEAESLLGPRVLKALRWGFQKVNEKKGRLR